MKDARKFFRLDCSFRVELSGDAGGEALEFGIAKNISAGGVCLLTDKPLPGKTELLLRFFFPERNDFYQLKGRVVWTNIGRGSNFGKYENGLEFLYIDSKLQQNLNQTIVNLHFDSQD